MNILVTGGLGYIGSHTAIELTNHGMNCVIIDRIKDKGRRLKKINELAAKPVQYMHCDLLNTKDVQKLFSRHKFDAVIHFAGLKSVSESTADPLRYFEHNLLSTINLLKGMKAAGTKQLVFSSSATVYGDLTPPPVREDAPTSVLSPYGRTKLVIEEMLGDIAQADPDLRIGILRYFNPVGAHESGRIGETPDGTPANLMPYVTQVASGKRNGLKVFGDDYPTRDGTGVRDYIHVMDLAAGHVKMLEFLQSQQGLHVFNLGTGTGYSVLELIRAFEKANNITIPFEVTDRRPGDIAASFADTTKAERLLNWKAVRGIEDMCRDAWRWEQASESGTFLWRDSKQPAQPKPAPAGH